MNYENNMQTLSHRTSLEKKIPKANSEPSQTSKKKLSAKIVNGFQPLTIFAKSSISDV